MIWMRLWWVFRDFAPRSYQTSKTRQMLPFVRTFHQMVKPARHFCPHSWSILPAARPLMNSLVNIWWRVLLSSTHCVFYFSKLRSGDPFTDSTLFGEETLTSSKKRESTLVLKLFLSISWVLSSLDFTCVLSHLLFIYDLLYKGSMKAP